MATAFCIGGSMTTAQLEHPDMTSKDAPRTMVEAVFHRLREDILSTRLAPGEKLRVEQLRAHYGVGSSTLREALSRLVSDTLVVAHGQRGFRVSPVSLNDFKSIADMRKLLETEALTASIAQGRDDWEADIVASFHRLTKVEERLKDGPKTLAADWERCNQDFHNALIGACQNHWLFHFRATLLYHSARYLRLALADQSVARDVHGEHEAIMRATLDRDAALACRLSTDHIERTVEVIAALAPDWSEE